MHHIVSGVTVRDSGTPAQTSAAITVSDCVVGGSGDPGAGAGAGSGCASVAAAGPGATAPPEGADAANTPTGDAGGGNARPRQQNIRLGVPHVDPGSSSGVVNVSVFINL